MSDHRPPTPRRRGLRRALLGAVALGAGLLAAAPAMGALTADQSRLVFSDLAGGAASDPKPVTISNPSGSSFTVTGLAISGGNANQFALSSPPSLPATVPAGGSVTVNVAFAPSSSGVKGATLTATTNDPAATSIPVVLRGLGRPSTGGEPSLQWVLDTWQIPVATGDTTPSNVALGSGGPMADEVDVERFEAAGPGPVTVTALAVFTTPGATEAASFGWHSGTDGSGRQNVFTVPAASARILDPVITGSRSFTPSGAFGLDATWPSAGNRVTYGEDALNLWEPTVANRHKMRVYPMRNPNGSAVANSFVVAFEDGTASPADNQDVVVVLGNVRAAAAPQGAEISIENLDGVPFPDRLVMSRIQSGAGGTVVHDVSTLRIHNTGSGALQVTGLPITGPFQLATPITLPATVPAFGTLDVPVRFTAQVEGPNGGRNDGTLTVLSSDADEPSTPVQLSGFWQIRPEGSNEGTLEEIFSIFGWTTRIVNPSGPGSDISRNGRVEAVGDEVLSPFWRRLDTGQPVFVRQLAAFHGAGTGTVYWHPQGDQTVRSIFTHDDLEYQTVLPRHTNLQGPAQGSFTPTTATFGFRLASAWSDDSLNGQTNQCLNDAANPLCGHVVRFWPIKDRAGVAIPGTYLAAMDFATATTGNYDYQDLIYLISNVAPASGGPPVDTTPPSLTARTPAVGATGVAVGANVTATFNEALSAASVSTSSVTLAPTAGGAAIPAAVSLGSGGTVVTLNPTSDLAAGTQYTATLSTVVEDVAGNNIPAAITWSFTTASGGPGPGTGPFLPSGGMVVMEAESFTANTPRGTDSWTLTTTPAGAVGSAMASGPDNGSGSGTPIPTTSPELTYPVDFPTTGTWHVWVRAYVPDTAGNSVHLGLDGATQAASTDLTNNSFGTWVWFRGRTASPTARIEVPTTGVHTVNVWMREDGLVLDRILLTTSSTYTPTGNGPAESPRS